MSTDWTGKYIHRRSEGAGAPAADASVASARDLVGTPIDPPGPRGLGDQIPPLTAPTVSFFTFVSMPPQTRSLSNMIVIY
jgi:hypothetical protein